LSGVMSTTASSSLSFFLGSLTSYVWPEPTIAKSSLSFGLTGL
jgi:hypothetical protein